MQIREISDYLESIAPLALQEEYDNSGLLIGNPEQYVESVLIALDVTPEVVHEAIEKHYGLIISHHPLIFRGLKKITGSSYVEKAVILAIKHDIAVYAIHTNLDNVLKNGVNEKIAERLSLKDPEVLHPSPDQPGTGAGVIGLLQRPYSELEFLSHLKEAMQLKVIRHTRLRGQAVERVAVCGGSGSFLLGRAIEAGAQFFVSADFKYHDFFDAEGKIVIADIGHFESERFTMDLLAGLMRIKFPNFAAHLTEKVTNPITYYPL